MESLVLEPISRVDGIVDLPGSKSISNRALLLASLASGKTILSNLLDSDDVRYMLDALKELGVNYTLSSDRTYCEVIGNSGVFIPKSSELELFLGNAGTVMRSLAGVLSLVKKNLVLTGSTRMKARPIRHLVDALRQGGAKIKYLQKEGYPPIQLKGGFIGGNIEVDGSVSSQFLTAMLIMAPLASKNTVLTVREKLVSKPYIDMTLHLMRCFGVAVENYSYRCFVVYSRQQYRSPGHYIIEGDASSASYFLAAGAIKGGTVKVTGIGCKSIQGDIHFSDVLRKMGAIITWGNDFIACTRRELIGIDMDMNDIPDSAMTIATTALFSSGITTLRNIYNWRVKETDRLFAMATELRKVGAVIEEGEDYIRIHPPSRLKTAEITTYGDHRIAMSFSLIALSDIAITILNPKCTEKTFPGYFRKLSSISIYS